MLPSVKAWTDRGLDVNSLAVQLAIRALVPQRRHEQQSVVGAVRALAAFTGTTYLGVGAKQLDDDVMGSDRAH